MEGKKIIFVRQVIATEIKLFAGVFIHKSSARIQKFSPFSGTQTYMEAWVLGINRPLQMSSDLSEKCTLGSCKIACTLCEAK